MSRWAATRHHQNESVVDACETPRVGDPFAPPPPGDWGYGAPPGPPPTNGVAISASVVGVLAILPAVTIVFVALAIEIVLFALVLDSTEVDIVDRREAEVDDYELSDRTCVVENGGSAAVASGLLTNRSGEEHAFVIEVRFLDRGLDLGRSSDSLETRLGDGQTWEWEVRLGLDPAAGVDTDGVQCRIVQVDLAEVAESG